MSSRQLTTSLVREAFLAYTKTGNRSAIDSFTLEELQIAHQGIGVKEQNTEYRRALRDEIENRKDGSTFTTTAVPPARQLVDSAVDTLELLRLLVIEQQITNLHLAQLTGQEITTEDTGTAYDN